MRNLELWNDYAREDAHAIFSPNTTFTPQAGTWGLQGIVRTPDRKGDWVFFVTFGKSQGEHTFDESITEDGVLSWQSQPAQRLRDETVQEFINHDERVNNIHLFLRAKDRSPYTYLGTLGYLTHDAERERPVYFQWQILEWPPPSGVLGRIELKLIPSPGESRPEVAVALANELEIVEPPKGKSERQGVPTQDFRKRKSPDYAARDAQNRALGRKGEELVITHEKDRLKRAGREDLAGQVTHVSVVEGDGAGYDVRSYEIDGLPRHIEVKTTHGPANTAFFMSSNEVAFNAKNTGSYYLYRLFEFNELTNSAKTFVLAGKTTAALRLTPLTYRAELSQANS